jgi:GNAT superfamily N-acetyltransferase
MTSIGAAVDPGQLQDVRRLMHGFLAWQRRRHHAEIGLVERYFDPAEFAAELERLPGEFAPPRGRLLLATYARQPAGCVALRDLGDGACEMKRMYVQDEFHGKGLGRALVEAIVGEARGIGYRVMRLNTGSRQFEAQALYRSVGFQPAAPYYELPEDLRSWLVFMELELQEPQQE